MATFFKFNQYVMDLASGVHQMQTGTAHVFKLYLSNAAPSASGDAIKTDLAEISTGNGYAGPITLTTTGAVSSGTFKFSATDVVITASGGTIGPFRYVAIYNDTPTSPADPLIGSWDYGASITLQDGETFTIDFDGTNGVLTVA